MPVPPPDRSRYDETLRLLDETAGAGIPDGQFPQTAALTLEQAVDQVLQSAALQSAALQSTGGTAPVIEGSTEKPPDLHIFALGAGRVLVGGRALSSGDWTYAKSREMLFYLLSHPAASKEKIGLDLWPEASSKQLRDAFHSVLHHLRQALGRPEWVSFHNGAYTFNRRLSHWYDVQVFEDLLHSAPLHKSPDSLSPVEREQAAHLLEEATQLYQGDFLENMDLGEWGIFRREELRQTFLNALLQLGELHFAQESYPAAAEIYRRVLSYDNYLELAHRGLMRCYARSGETSQALRHYENLHRLLQKELGAPPSPETKLLYERLQRGDKI